MIAASGQRLQRTRSRHDLRARAAGVLAQAAILAFMVAACSGGDAPDRRETMPAPTAGRLAASAGATGPGPAEPVPAAVASATVDVGLKALAVEPAFPALAFRRPVHLTYSPDGTDRLFVTLQAGRIMVFENDEDVSTAQEFLDIRELVNDRGNEEGLLGLAFDPDYGRNGYFYVYYTAGDPRRSVVSRFSVSDEDPEKGDAASEMPILQVRQPFANHNGGQILFGPDGFLYVGLGDGGGQGDSAGNAQNPSTLLGAILRIDVGTLDSKGTYTVPADNPFAGSGGGVQGEIWAYGLRNPWRFSFDRETGDMWAGDVGQGRYEEVDVITPGANYGWNVAEASHCYRPSRGCNQANLAPPVIEYGREDGCSITGGYVYRGSLLPSLLGAYVYGDFCSGKIWALRHDGTRVTEHMLIVDSGLSISSFGEDGLGELLVLSLDGGIYRFVEPE